MTNETGTGLLLYRVFFLALGYFTENFNAPMKLNLIILSSFLCATLTWGASQASLESGFAEPPQNAGIRAFWWWLNSNVTKEAITRDLEEMKAKHFSGAMIFDADGSSQRRNARVPAGPIFGSPEWTELWVHTCKEAKRLDLELSLNIQSGWNLGGPSVTAEESTQHLIMTKTQMSGGTTIKQKLPRPAPKENYYRDVTVIAVPVVKGRREPIKNLHLKNATRELGLSAPDCRFLLDVQPAKLGEAIVPAKAILDISDRMDKSGQLVWKAPEGEWEVIRIGHASAGAHVSTHTKGAGGRVLNYLSPEMLRRYWGRMIAPLMEAIGPLAGTTVKYIHTDSWEGGGMNWTSGFAEEFKERRGYSILPWLAVLSGHVVESREASNAFLADFRKTIGELVAEHYAELARLARKYGMGTHPECSGPHAGPLDGLENYRHSELMMSEFWSPSPHRPTPSRRFFVKQAASAAHTYGKQLVGAEGFTTIGPHWNDTPWKDMKPSFDRELCAGLNLLFVHTFTCSPPEMGLPGQEYFAGTHFNPQVTWWEESPAFIEYFNRCQFLTQQAKFVADVLHYYGDHIPNIFGSKAADPAGALPGYDYDVLSEELLIDTLEVEEGMLVLPSGMRYRILTLPNHRVLSLGAIRKINELVRAGATVLGPKPEKTVTLEGPPNRQKRFQVLADRLWGNQSNPAPGIRKVGKGQVAWGMTATELLHKQGVPPDVERSVSTGDPEQGEVDWIHYRIGDADFYFIAELAGQTCRSDFLFRVEGRIPEFWNPVDGSIQKAFSYTIAKGRTQVHLKLGPYDSLFIVFREPVGDQIKLEDGPNWKEFKTLQSVDGPWQVKFNPKWGGPDRPVLFEKLVDWTKHKDEKIKHYSGKAHYRSSFELASLPDNTRIELGEVRATGIVQVKLNGKDLGLAWRPPFSFPARGALREGNNELEIMVLNSWHNRVMADDELPDDERFTRTNIRVERKNQFAWKPEPSGLIGPVQLVVPIE
ncbi:MAG: glycoside hydrolase [Verrucomicrobiae bacterium]|nr:glycoside hydrolase [Verrucomicrobiae bacterium]NNJ42323.1 glycoside hydrolase [Akkermansiaceae bacterium]